MIARTIRRLFGDRKGGTAIEYGLIAALIVITMIASFVEVARTTTALWNNTNMKMEDARNGR